MGTQLAALEREADRVAGAVVGGYETFGLAPSVTDGAPRLQRQTHPLGQPPQAPGPAPPTKFPAQETLGPEDELERWKKGLLEALKSLGIGELLPQYAETPDGRALLRFLETPAGKALAAAVVLVTGGPAIAANALAKPTEASSRVPSGDQTFGLIGSWDPISMSGVKIFGIPLVPPPPRTSGATTTPTAGSPPTLVSEPEIDTATRDSFIGAWLTWKLEQDRALLERAVRAATFDKPIDVRTALRIWLDIVGKRPAAETRRKVSPTPEPNRPFKYQFKRQASREHSPISDDSDAIVQGLQSPARPLEPSVQRLMESRFGYDFREVRIHTDAQAAASAHALGALAYTMGQHVVFGAAMYAPSSSDGRRLLAHELTHTIQQGAARSRGSRFMLGGRNERPTMGFEGLASPAPCSGEMEARMIAAGDAPATPRVRTGVGLARQPDVPEFRVAGAPFNTAVAEREPGLPPDGAIFNGVVLMIRRRGETVLQVGAHSGFQSPAEWQRQGPIPDGSYFLRPTIAWPPVKTYQYGGSAGALGIDAGYQRIEDKAVQGAWGHERIAIEPSAKCVPLPAGESSPSGMVKCGLSGGRLGVFRDGFYIHGGSGEVTSGCIKIPHTGDDAGRAHEVFKTLRSMGSQVPLLVAKLRKKVRPTE